MEAGTTRRELVGGSLAAAGAALAMGSLARRAAARPDGGDKASKGLKILVLGGTRFLGPAIVDRAIVRGHTVTLFNRGKSNPGMYPDLEKLRGNRGSHGGRGREPSPVDLKSLEGRTWDVAIDTSGYWPEFVKESSAFLADKVEHYIFISTISVYPGFGTSNETIDEDSSLGDLKPREEYEGFHYGPYKALCEQETEKAMPGRVANVRPGLIVGPLDPTDRFAWWPARVHRGGEVLAPGDGSSPCQWIDARDLGRWCVHIAEEKIAGVYNATGFNGPLSMMEFLHGCKCAIRTDCSFTWASEAFLEEHKVAPFMQMPLWIPEKGLPYVKVDRAVAKGLTFRPVADTVQDTIAWLEKDRGGVKLVNQRIGLPAEREASLLKAWHESQKKPK